MWNPFRKAAPQRAPTEAPLRPQILYLANGMSAGIIEFKDYVAAEQAMQHPITYRALDKIASSVQQVRWYVQEDPDASPAERRGKAVLMRDLQALLESPNDTMTAAMLRYWMALNYAAYGRVPLKFGLSSINNGRFNGIYPLETRYVDMSLNRRGGVEFYEYGPKDDQSRYPSFQRWRQDGQPRSGFVDQIIKLGLRGYPDKRDVNSPLQAVGLPSQVIRLLLHRAIQSAAGHPNVRYLVTCSKTLTEPQLNALRDHLNTEAMTGGEYSGKVPVLQNAADVEIHKLDNDLSDIHSKMPSDDMARLIFGAFGIPIALAGMGAADGAKFAGNYIESRQAFWQDTIIPMYVMPIFQGLSKFICPPGLIIRPDLDSIPALMQGRIESMKEVDPVTFLTRNEKREMFGWDPEADDDEEPTNVEETE